MDARLFTQMMADSNLTDLKKLHYKYPDVDMREFVSLLKESIYVWLPRLDFQGEPTDYLENVTQVQMKSLRTLLQPQQRGRFGLRAMEDEIGSTLKIEGIDTSRDSVRRI